MTAASESVRLSDECEASPLCPLNRARAGASVRIKRLPESGEMITRLREIGLGEEQVVKLVSAQSMVVCQVCNARVAIGAALAETILVEPISLAKAA
jgi:Fe2+ transport system protein FeoA